MNGPALQPDDPKLTAYALGELSGDERAAVEAALRECPELRPIVEEIRATALQLAAALEGEPIVTETDRWRAPLSPARGQGRGLPRGTAAASRGAGPEEVATAPAGGDVYRRRSRRGKLIRFPQFYFVIGGLAAACFAVMVILNQDEHALRQQQRLAAEARARQPVPELVAIPLAPAAPLTGPAGETMAVTIVPAVPAPGSSEAIEPAVQRLAGGSGFAQAEPSQPETLQPRTGPRLLTPGAGPVAETNATPSPLRLNPATPDALPAGVVGPVTLERLAQAGSPPKAKAAFPPNPEDEIVLLDAFTVRADILHGFTTLSEINRAATASRGLEERRNLPRAPAAAQFARNTEAYSQSADNAFLRVAEHPTSTIAAEVDTASYTHIRRMIEQDTPPPRDAVRIEELLNYFPYRYPAPVAERGDTPPFAAALEVAEAPWAPAHRLVRIGLKSREVSTAERPPANLVFLIDVSASMADLNKLPLVKESMRLLVGKLRNDDRVALVVYAGESGLALPSTPVAKRREILDALAALKPGGSTNGALGIHLAYDIAKAHFIRDGINRVILCTDGDFNVGTTHRGELMTLIEEKAASGVFLTVLGFGMGNLKDATLESLAHKGNGHYGYIGSRREAEKLLGEQVSGTLVSVAKDVKIQVEFNPAKVASYRLIGYENRQLRREDFNSDKVDAGGIGAGHAVTALYEVVPFGVGDQVTPAPSLADPKYQAKGAVSSRLEMPIGPPEPPSSELLTVTVRYKRPDGIVPRTKEFELVDAGGRFAQASADFRFAAAVAQFGMILRESPHKGNGTLGDVVAWAASAAAGPAGDPGGYRGEFIDLVRKTQRMLLR